MKTQQRSTQKTLRTPVLQAAEQHGMLAASAATATPRILEPRPVIQGIPVN